MKRILFIILLSLITAVNAVSQTSGHCVIQTEKHDNILYLYMNPQEYGLLSDVNKTALIAQEAANHQVQTVYVISAYDGELWQMADNSMTKIDSWNKETASLLPGAKNGTSPRSLEHPWFLNFSGALSRRKDLGTGNSSQFLFNTYGRAGCYLYKGKWDLALNVMLGYQKNKDSKGSFSGSIGVDSRVYFLKGKTVNPFAGIGLAYASSGGTSSFTLPISVGMSVPVRNKGCIDICYQYSKVTSSAFIAGFTYMLQ